MISTQGLILYADFAIVPETRGAQFFRYLHRILVLLTPSRFPGIRCHTAELGCV